MRETGLTRWQAEKILAGRCRGFRLGSYTLLSMLGKGGMSSVYLAEHVVMQRRCAVKVLPTKLLGGGSHLDRFLREARAVAALDHPNIVRAFDMAQDGEGSNAIHFLVMELVEGRSLYDLIKRDGPAPVGRVREIGRQAALGLAHAHGAGLVHRDVKPGNILLAKDGTVKVTDLGPGPRDRRRGAQPDRRPRREGAGHRRLPRPGAGPGQPRGRPPGRRVRAGLHPVLRPGRAPAVHRGPPWPNG